MTWLCRAVLALCVAAALTVPARAASPLAQTRDDKAAEGCREPVSRLIEGDALRDLHPRALGFVEQGRALFAAGRYGEALALYDCAFAIRAQIQTQLRTLEPGAEQYDRAFAALWDAIGDARMALNRKADALEAYEFAYAVAQSVVERAGQSPMLGLYLMDLAMSHTKLGNAHAARKEITTAFEDYDRALAIAARLADANPGAPGPMQLQIFIHGAMSFALAAVGAPEAALKHDLASLAILREVLKQTPNDAFLLYEYAQAHGRIGARGGAGACEHLTEAVRILQRLDTTRQLNVPQEEMALLVNALRQDQCKSRGGASSP